MNYKFVSSQHIVSKIYRDFKLKDSSWELDALEWIGEAMEFIGTFSGFELRERLLRIKDYKGKLPTDVYALTGIKIGQKKLIAENPVDPFFQDKLREMVYLTNMENSEYGFTALMTIPDQYYFQSGNYVKTSFRNGVVRLQYLAFPTDDCGYPMIPDTVYVKQAIEWYIISRMILGGFQHPSIDWRTADYEWKRYCVSAGNDLAYPSVDKVENFMDSWVRLIPDIRKPQTTGKILIETSAPSQDAASSLPKTVQYYQDNYWLTDSVHGNEDNFISAFEEIYDTLNFL